MAPCHGNNPPASAPITSGKAEDQLASEPLARAARDQTAIAVELQLNAVPRHHKMLQTARDRAWLAEQAIAQSRAAIFRTAHAHFETSANLADRDIAVIGT